MLDIPTKEDAIIDMYNHVILLFSFLKKRLNICRNLFFC
jgi:hypothetical protein